jgi:hypothetical protein
MTLYLEFKLCFSCNNGSFHWAVRAVLLFAVSISSQQRSPHASSCGAEHSLHSCLASSTSVIIRAFDLSPPRLSPPLCCPPSPRPPTTSAEDRRLLRRSAPSRFLSISFSCAHMLSTRPISGLDYRVSCILTTTSLHRVQELQF